MVKEIPKFELAEILSAIENNEFFLIAQPQVNLDNLDLIGFECLARWQHPQYGVLGPFYFIDVLEQHQHCHLLTFKLLERLIAKVSTLSHTYSNIHYSLNISAHDLLNDSFASYLASLIDKYGVDPKYVVLEVTETAGIFNHKSVENLRRVASLGFQLAVDDFWTGFSTLETIRLNIFNEVKIDYSLTSQLINDKTSMAGVNAILQLCSDLGLRCVVEGIETCMARGILLEAGATVGQGFLFGKGVNELELDTWIAQYQSGQYPIACNNATLFVNEQEHLELEQRPHPSWLWDFSNNKILWANSSALELWCEENLESLKSKDFSVMSYLVKTRLESYRRRFIAGEGEISSEWDFYPKGQHKKVFCIQIPRADKLGNQFMMVHGFVGFHSRLPPKKYIDSNNRFPAPFLIVDDNGKIVQINKHAHIDLNVETDCITELITEKAFEYIKSNCQYGHLVETFVRNQKVETKSLLYIRAIMVPDQQGSERSVLHIVVIPVSETLTQGITDISK